MEFYLAYAILFVLWVFVVTPMIGCIFTIEYSCFKSDFEVGIKVQIVIGALCAFIGVVTWALDVVAEHLQ